jgi:RND family efflux transporter MFP subunit
MNMASFVRDTGKGLRFTVTAIIGIVFGHATATAQPAQAVQPRVPSVGVVDVRRAPISETVIVTGTLIARDEVMVAAQVDGLAITSILVEEGDTVQAGQVLAQLSRDTVDAQLTQNAAQLLRAEAAIAQARSQIEEANASEAQAAAAFQRAQALRQGGIASAETFDTRQANARTAAARVSSAEQALRLAEADRQVTVAQRRELEIRRERTDIRAPVAGVVSRRTARLGAIAAGAGDPLFRIIADAAVELEADVAEVSMARIAVGQPVAVRPAGFNTDVTGKVRLVAPEVSRSTRLGRVRVALETRERLPLGSFARATITVAQTNGLLAPQSALLHTPTGVRVQRVRDGVVESVAVETGLRAEGVVELRSGVAEGDLLVSTSGTFLRNGDRVNPIAASQ